MNHEYRFVGSHADHLANGRPVAPGDFVTLSEGEVDDNKRLVDEGQLRKIEKPGRRKVTEQNEEGSE
jgi:hypothetical protein